jgi:hypothetical protein
MLRKSSEKVTGPPPICGTQASNVDPSLDMHEEIFVFPEPPPETMRERPQ